VISRHEAGYRRLCLAALLAGCGGGSDGLGPTGSPTSLRFSRDTATIGIDGNVALIPREVGGRAIAPEALQWSSSDAAVASVSAAGLVTGVAGGEVEIRVRVAELGDTARITVLPFISLGTAEPRTIDADGNVGGIIGSQPFIWSRGAGLRRLPNLPGTSGGGVFGLAGQGTAVGTSGGGDLENGHPVVWTLLEDGTATVEALPWDGGPTGFAHGVAAAGDRIVGQVFAQPAPNRYNPYPALWTRAANGIWLVELLPVPVDGYGAAFKVNQTGHVLGLVEADGPQGFTTSVVVWTRLPDLTWAREAVATGALGTVSAGGLNAADAVAGAQDDRAMLWTRSGAGWTSQDLGDLGGGEFSFASDINDAGTVVGATFDSRGRQRAISWAAATGMRDLGSLSVNASASALNATGAVAGLSYHPESSTGQIGTLWPAP